MAQILKGAPVCAQIRDDLKSETRRLRLRGVHPKMAIIRVGEREDDISYERNTIKICDAADIRTERHLLPETATEQDVIDTIEAINRDTSVHGLMLFRPLPKSLDEAKICSHISPDKDIDGITDASIASVFIGRDSGFAPCTAEACIRLLDFYGVELSGARVAIIGRSMVVGKPLAMMLIKRNATVTVCHTKTRNMADICREADVLIAAAGRSHLVGVDFLNDRQYVVDVGFNVNDLGDVTGDVDFQAAEPFVAAITPVPGGVGSITARILAEHTVIAAKRLTEPMV